jgi:hypothetical protein
MNKLSLRIKILTVLFAGSLVFTACNENKETEGTERTGEVTKDTVAEVNTNLDLPDMVSIPSPVELFELIREGGATFKGDLMNSPDNSDKYNNSKIKAINFGVYAADLSYASVFDKNQQTFSYFKVTMEMANQLGLMKGFDEKMLNRISENINNSDSLFFLATEAYLNARNHLDNEEDADLFPLMIYGGWLESVYIAVNSVDNFSQDDEVLLRVAEQGAFIENVIDLLQTFNTNEDLADVIEELIEIQMVFDELMENDDDTLITKEQFDRIKSLVLEYRSKYVS